MKKSLSKRFVNPDEPEAWKLTEHKSMLKCHVRIEPTKDRQLEIIYIWKGKLKVICP